MVTIIVLIILALASGTLFVLSSKARPGLKLGKTLGYALIFVVLMVASVGVALAIDLAPSATFWLLFGLSLIGGVLHTWLLHKRFAWVQKELFLSELLLTLLIYSVGSILVCLLFNSFTSVSSVAFLAGAALAFLVPFFVHKSFLLWQVVPPPYFYKWFFPTDKEVPVLTFQNTIPLQFTFYKEVNHDDSTTFSVVAPTNIHLGDLFHSFLEEYNQHNPESPIQSYRPPFSWMFYCDTGNWWKPRKIVDPNVSIFDNEIKPSESVNAVRIHK